MTEDQLKELRQISGKGLGVRKILAKKESCRGSSRSRTTFISWNSYDSLFTS